MLDLHRNQSTDLLGRSANWFLYESNIPLMWVNINKSFGAFKQPLFTCLKVAIETPEKCVKSVQS